MEIRAQYICPCGWLVRSFVRNGIDHHAVCHLTAIRYLTIMACMCGRSIVLYVSRITGITRTHMYTYTGLDYSKCS